MRRKSLLALTTAIAMTVGTAGCASNTDSQATTGSAETVKETEAETTAEEKTTEETTVPETSSEAETTKEPETESVEKSDDAKTSEELGEKAPETGEKYDDGYTLVWQDNFDAEQLDMDSWNFEYHEPGWVNNELQSYGSNSENTYLQDGALVIQPLKIENADGTVSYTSGRVNTQNKHDFKYGKFEIRAKVPQGKGFLPAIWMMPTDENLYGQWPKCGEIDIMEVLGDKTRVLYSTLHYGEPHSEGQGSYELPLKNNFAKEYHTFTCEWEPGIMSFYVDGMKYHTENDWFTKRNGFGEVTFPAPYDQPFYLILNVAVGGNWPGNPDETTPFDERAQMCIDYVRVYQKDEYDENVTKPEKVVNFREPDETGNFVVNGNFEDENVNDTKDWYFLTANKGKGECFIENNEICINTDDFGEVDYSIQLVQPEIPMIKGNQYRLTFDAVADEDRTIISAITAPNAGWIRYLKDTYVDVTTEKQSYSFDITMNDDSDAYARIEFNLGNQGSTAGVRISNVRFELLEEGEVEESVGCLPDGNYIHNGEFQEGNDRMDFWRVESETDNIECYVTNVNNVREFTAVIPEDAKGVKLVQDKLGISGNTDYILQFTAHADDACTVKVKLAGQEFEAELSDDSNSYTYKLTTDEKAEASDLVFELDGAAGRVVSIDDVRVFEDALLLNGSFSAGMTGYEIYAYTSTDVNYVVDTLNEDSALCVDITNTGDLDWKIQLKQSGILLEKGAKYRLTFDAKSTLDRAIMFALQRDGSSDDDWTPYSGSCIAELTDDFDTYSVEFEMEYSSDKNTILSISMGAVQGTQIDEKHTVVIDNISLEKLS